MTDGVSPLHDEEIEAVAGGSGFLPREEPLPGGRDPIEDLFIWY